MTSSSAAMVTFEACLTTNGIAVDKGISGFKFNTGAGTQYGWVRIEIQHVHKVGMIVFEYAWGDPGERILIGQRSSMSSRGDTVPESGSLALLALGAAGLIAWRERRAP